MNLSQQIFAQAAMIAGDLEQQQEALLRLLCGSSASVLASRLREGIRPEDCAADFVTAACLFALAALSEAEGMENLESFTAGDVTVHKRDGSTAAKCLRHQAELMIAPYSTGGFGFRGV